MRYLFFLCLFITWSVPLFADELRLITDDSQTWVARHTPQLPATDRERLAVRAVDAGTTVKQDSLTAYSIGRKDSFDLVTVEEEPESATEDFHAVSSYQVRNGRIWGDTRIKYVAKPNPEHEQIALEIAKDYLLGRISNIPVIFNGRVYVADYDGKCILTVVEKDDATVHFTYRYSRCGKPSHNK